MSLNSCVLMFALMSAFASLPAWIAARAGGSRRRRRYEELELEWLAHLRDELSSHLDIGLGHGLKLESYAKCDGAIGP